MKYGLGGRIMKHRVSLRPKTYNYLKNDGYVSKKKKDTKKCAIKHEIKFEDYKNCLENNCLEKIAIQSKALRVKHTMYLLRT